MMPAKGMVLRRRFEPPKSSMFNPIETDKISIRQENEESTYTSGFDQTLRIGTNSQQKLRFRPKHLNIESHADVGGGDIND